MRVKIIGSTESARVVRSYLEKAGVAVCEHLPRFALHCTVHLSEHSGQHIIVDSVDSPLEQHVLRHITENITSDVVLRRRTGLVSTQNEIHLSVPAGDPDAAHAVEVGILRGVQRAHFHRPWWKRLLPLAVLALVPAANAGPSHALPSLHSADGAIHITMPETLFPQIQVPSTFTFTAGSLNVNCTGGCTGGGGGNAAAGLTGAAVPTSADYTGFNSGGNLVGVSTANPLPVAQQGTVTVAGTVTATPPYTLGQKVMASSVPVAIASDQSGLPVTGTFFQATQPVSAAALPLPSGAATSTIQTNGTQVTQVSNFPATQAISGTITVSNPSSGGTLAAPSVVTVANPNVPASINVTNTPFHPVPVSLSNPAALASLINGNCNAATVPAHVYCGNNTGSSTAPSFVQPNIGDIAAGTSSNLYTINGACSLNGVLYVGGSCATFWGGGDIGAQINAAYAAGPSTGVHIHVSPGVYNYTTPILFQTVFKPVFLECAPGVSSNFATVTATTQLNYTPSTGTALNLGTHGSRINGCQIQGAALANSSIGVLLGGTVVGCVYCVLEHVDINQFGVGLQLGANIYVDSFYNVTIHDNGQDILYPSGTAGSGEGLRFYGGSISNKAATFSQSCISLQGNNMEISFIHTSIDQCGIVENGLNDRLDFNDPHFENPNGATALPFIKMDTACTGCEIKTQGGRWIEDFASARTEFILDAATGNNVSNSITVIGGSYEPFQTVAQLVHSTQANCCALTFVGGATTLTSFGFTNWVNASSAGNLWYNALVTAADYIQNSEQTAPAGLTNTDFLWADSVDHIWNWTGNNSAVQHLPQTTVLHTAYTNATTTFSTLSDGTRTASFPVAANRDYTLNCDISYQSSATTAGPKIQLTGPASPTAVNLRAMGGTGATAFADAAVTAFSTPLTAFGTAGATATNFILRISAGISNGVNAGTVALQLAANGVGTLTVPVGSSCQIQ